VNRYARRIRPFVKAELEAARCAEYLGRSNEAVSHLERAHVLSQGSTAEHVRVHWQMLLSALRQHRKAEAAGQVLRLVGAATKTTVGLVPPGNTGSSNVSAFRSMPVAADLQRLIDDARR
jgi:Protein of unknown function (DUF3703)